MISPTREQIKTVIELLEKSIQELIEKDSNIFNAASTRISHASRDEILLDRKLHEIAINHRLAYYLEKNIQRSELNIYNVDIEYNRYYSSPKQVMTVEGLLTARPDIVIHSRTDSTKKPQHYLIIEAKKGGITPHDINKVKGFIEDSRYNYLFGFTISYRSSATSVDGDLFYFDGNEIRVIPICVNKY